MKLDTKHIRREAFHILCGPVIGGGAFRKVFECRVDQTLVVKVEAQAYCFHNVAEWETWNNLHGTEAGKWLAPCHFISPCGSILLMERAEPLRPSEVPKKLPAFLDDCHAKNFGLLNGRVVAIDYGYTRPTFSTKLVRKD